MVSREFFCLLWVLKLERDLESKHESKHIKRDLEKDLEKDLEIDVQMYKKKLSRGSR